MLDQRFTRPPLPPARRPTAPTSLRRCRAAYHLPCAQGAPGVVLERDTFESWCPAHADPDGAASDEDFSLAAPRPRRVTGGWLAG